MTEEAVQFVSVLCVGAAHCLHTVTEDNPELLCGLKPSVLGVLENVLLSSQPGMAHILLRTLAAGAVCHFFSNELLKPLTCKQHKDMKVTLKKKSSGHN